MEKVAIFYRLKPGVKDTYIKRHKEIWPEMTEIMDVAGLRNYTIWCQDDMLFGYYEVKDKARADRILAESPVYNRWREEMSEFIWTNEAGQKEWFMEQVFFHE